MWEGKVAEQVKEKHLVSKSPAPSLTPGTQAES